MNTKLQAKIDARNQANQEAVKLYHSAVQALTPFVGQKVCKADGLFLKKVKDALPKVDIQNGRGFFTMGTLGYDIRVEVDCWRTDGNVTRYQKTIYYIAELQNGVLVKFYDVPTFNTIIARYPRCPTLESGIENELH